MLAPRGAFPYHSPGVASMPSFVFSGRMISAWSFFLVNSTRPLASVKNNRPEVIYTATTPPAAAFVGLV